MKYNKEQKEKIFKIYKKLQKMSEPLTNIGDVHVATALVFDVGVYLAVVGLCLEILRSLGGEIDRHGEIEGLDNQDHFTLTASDDERRAVRDEAEMQEMLAAWEEEK